MKMAVDRPRDVLYTHPNGTRAEIHFQWSDDPNNPIPKKIDVRVLFESGHQVIHDETRYSSFEDARERGLQLAKAVIDGELPSAQ